MRTLAITAAIGALFAAQPASAQELPLSLEQHYQCAAMFLVQSKALTDPEEKSAFEGAIAFTLRSSFPLGKARGLTEDQMIDAAAEVADDIETRMAAAPGQGENILWAYGPGMQRCLTVVLEASEG